MACEWGAIRYWLTALVATMLFTACGAAASPSASHRDRPSLPTSPLPWSAFPVNAKHRPLVFVGPLVVDPSSGFDNGADKLAYVEGALRAPQVFPPGPRQIDGYPLISAVEAFGRLTSGKKAPASSDALEITSVRLGAAVFQTDRGPLRLPAWLFAIQNVRDTAKVAAVAPASIFTARTTIEGRAPSVGDARLGADGRTLTLQFAGEPAGTQPCTADYALGVVQSRTTVSVTVHEHAHDSGVACAQPASQRQATVRLAAPLGARVVLDGATGTAVAVTGAGPSS